MEKSKKQVNILLTGGHGATSAISIAQELKKSREIHWKVSWVGSKFSTEETLSLPFEYDVLPGLGVKVYAISAAKLQSKFTKNTIPAILRFPASFIEGLLVFLKIRPQAVLSFGGSAALPIVFWAWVFRTPVVLHEQTVATGLSNKIAGFFATKIALGREASIQFFKREKCVVTGNPLMSSILELSNFKTEGKNLFVVGGSRGSQTINNIVFQTLPDLLSKYHVVHQTGTFDFEKAKAIKAKLSPGTSGKYEIYEFINPINIGQIYMDVKLMVARAGAHTVSEVLALGIPTLFIPIPWVRLDEQAKNARFAEDFGIAHVLSQDVLSPRTFEKALYALSKDAPNMKKTYEKHPFVLDKLARTRIVSLLLSVIS